MVKLAGVNLYHSNQKLNKFNDLKNPAKKSGLGDGILQKPSNSSIAYGTKYGVLHKAIITKMRHINYTINLRHES